MKRCTRRQFMRRACAATVGTGPFIWLARGAVAEGPRRYPNFLLFFPDQHRYDWTGMNPRVPVRTPNLVKLAKEGVWFQTAFCPSPLCAPSRASLALGKEYDRTGVKSNRDNLPESVPTLYSLLRDAGYRVGSVGKLDFRKPEHDWGEDGLHRVGGREYFREWGFTDGFDSEGKGDSFRGITGLDGKAPLVGASPYTKMLMDRQDGSLERYVRWREDQRQSGLSPSGHAYTRPIELAEEAYNDNWVGQNGLNLVRGFPQEQPWFLQVNFPGPHNPMDITPAMAEWYRDTEFPGPYGNTQLPPDVHTAIRRNYSAMVENIDRWLGRYLEAIEQRGELEDTVVAYSSDHGEMLGDHNRWAKTVPYQPSVGVPLMICGPGVRKGHVHRGPAETLDLTATFLDYAGALVPKDMDSRSMRPLLEGKTNSHRTHAFSGLGEWRMVYDGRYKLIIGFDAERMDTRGQDVFREDGPVLLFDLRNDPAETQNVAQEKPVVVKRLTGLLKRRAR